MHDFKRLEVWKISMSLAESVYKITNDFPSSERFGLTNQLRRSAISIPSNIAEGAGRGDSKKIFHYFLKVAYGSTCELETQLLLSNRLGFTENKVIEDLIIRISIIQKMIYNLSKTLGIKR